MAAKHPVLIMVDVKSQVLFPEIGKLLDERRVRRRVPDLPVHRLGPRRLTSRSRAVELARIRHLDRVMLGALIVIFAGFAIAYTRITPIGASPDELSHLHYITGISDHFRLPPAGEPERQQPPLYYLLGAVVAKLTGDDPRLIRLLSVALGVLTILTVYLVARRLFPLRPGLAVGAAALVALLPETQYLAGGDQRRQPRLARRRAAGACGGQRDAEQVADHPARARRRPRGGAGGRSPRRRSGCSPPLLLVLVVVRFWRRLRAVHVAALRRADDRARRVVVRAQRGGRSAARCRRCIRSLLSARSSNSLSQVRGYLAATALSMVGHVRQRRALRARSRSSGRDPLPSVVAVAAIGAHHRRRLRREWCARGADGTRRGAGRDPAAVVILVAVAQSVLNSATFDLQPQARYLLVAVAAAAPIAAWTIAWRRSGPL